MTTPPPGAHQPPPPEAIQEALRGLLSSRTEWDEMPQWGLLYTRPGGTVDLKPMLTPPHVWSTMRPARVLEHVGEALRNPTTGQRRAVVREVRAALPPALCGAYIRTEGWAPPVHLRDEIVRRDRAGGSTPPISKLPGRIEMRVGSAVDSTGRAYMAMQERGSDDVLSEYDGGGEGAAVSLLDGNVPKALLAVLTALLPPAGR